jgi:hypothetical protein
MERSRIKKYPAEKVFGDKRRLRARDVNHALGWETVRRRGRGRSPVSWF